MDDEPIKCEVVAVTESTQTRRECGRDAVYKVGIPHESLERRYVCETCLHFAQEYFRKLYGMEPIVFDLKTRLIVEQPTVRASWKWWKR